MDLASSGAEVPVSVTSVRDVDRCRLPCVVMVGRGARRRLAGPTVLFAAGLLLAACSSGASDEVIPLTAPETIAPAPTSAPPTSSTSTAAPTPASSTSTPPLPSSTTAAQPTSSTTTPEELRFEIEAALNASRAAAIEAVTEPVGSLTEEQVLLFDEEGLAARIRFIDGIVGAGQAVRPGPLGVENIVVESAVVIDEDSVLVVFCLSSDSILYDISTGAIVDDAQGAFRNTGVVTRVDARWRVPNASRIGTFEGLSCQN